jgi:glycosyltransferase involved in cell wall biosynthesis
VEPDPYTWTAYHDPGFAAGLRAMFEEGTYDLVHCDHIQVARAFVDLPTPPRLLNAHNVETVLVRRLAECERSPWKRALINWQYLKTRRAEALAHACFDRSVVVSAVDRAELERIVPARPVSIVPNGVDTTAFFPAGGPPLPHTMVFTGVMDWRPNVDGIVFFTREVLPRIRRSVPQAELIVVGRNPSPALVRQLGELGVRVTGAVQDIRPYLAQAALVVVPLRIGGGTRLKILEAWASGKAVLSTSIGAEGLPIVDGENIAIADRPDDIAERAVALLGDKHEAARLGMAGRHLVEEHFSWRRIAEVLLEAYEATADAARGGSPLATALVG